MPEGNDKDRGAASAAPRLVGTVVLTLATSVLYAGGLWAAWTALFSNVTAWIGVPAMIGVAIAPIALIADIVSADRADRAKAVGQADVHRGKDETMD